MLRRSNGSISEINTAYANEGDLETSGLDLNLPCRLGLDGAGRLGNWLQVASRKRPVSPPSHWYGADLRVVPAPARGRVTGR